MKIATYNVNGIKSRLGQLVGWLEREQPDVACLQELKATSETFPMLEIHGLALGRPKLDHRPIAPPAPRFS